MLTHLLRANTFTYATLRPCSRCVNNFTETLIYIYTSYLHFCISGAGSWLPGWQTFAQGPRRTYSLKHMTASGKDRCLADHSKNSLHFGKIELSVLLQRVACRLIHPMTFAEKGRLYSEAMLLISAAFWDDKERTIVSSVFLARRVSLRSSPDVYPHAWRTNATAEELRRTYIICYRCVLMRRPSTAELLLQVDCLGAVLLFSQPYLN